MITAEEFGISGDNYNDFVNSENPGINRLLNSNLGLGTDANPLSDTWMQSVLNAVGNYYDAYDRSFCDGNGQMENCLIDRAGTLNDLVANGGIQYAPPMR
jgi:general L-amino acid transport system substrate-binding protein